MPSLAPTEQLDYDACAALLAASLRLALHDAATGNMHAASAIALPDCIAPHWRNWPKPRSSYLMAGCSPRYTNCNGKAVNSHVLSIEAITRPTAQEAPD